MYYAIDNELLKKIKKARKLFKFEYQFCEYLWISNQTYTNIINKKHKLNRATLLKLKKTWII